MTEPSAWALERANEIVDAWYTTEAIDTSYPMNLNIAVARALDEARSEEREAWRKRLQEAADKHLSAVERIAKRGYSGCPSWHREDAAADALVKAAAIRARTGE